MVEVISLVITASISILTVLITSVGVTQAGRLRRELASLTSMIGQVPSGTPARIALERLIDLAAARLLALRLVRPAPYWVGIATFLLICAFVGGIFTRDPIASTLLTVGFSVSAYVVGGWQFSRVWRLRRRQARAILAGRPSGQLVMEPEPKGLRRSVRNRVLRPDEYPLVPFLRWSFTGRA
jgi:hypothetical protein